MMSHQTRTAMFPPPPPFDMVSPCPSPVPPLAHPPVDYNAETIPNVQAEIVVQSTSS